MKSPNVGHLERIPTYPNYYTRRFTQAVLGTAAMDANHNPLLKANDEPDSFDLPLHRTPHHTPLARAAYVAQASVKQGQAMK